MNTKTLGILGGVTAVVVLAALWTTSGPGTPKTATPAPSPGKDGAGTKGGAPAAAGMVFPSLADKLTGVASIVVQSADKETTIAKSGDAWGVVAKSNFPADFDKVRDALLSLAELKITESKTQQPDKYAFLGVTDPTVKDSPARLVTLKDTSGQAVASVVIGNTAPSAGAAPRGETRTEVYVRRAGEAQAYQAAGRLDPRNAFDPDPLTWVKRDVVSIDAPRVKSVTVTHPDGTRLKIEKDSKDAKEFAVRDLPAGRELKYAGAASPTAGALSSVNFDDVAPVATAAEGATPSGSAEFVTFDGVTVTVETSTKNGVSWATFAARYDAPDADPVPSNQTPPDANSPEAAEKKKKSEDAKKEAETLNAKLSKWAFALPEFKVKQFQTTMDELLKPADEPKKDQPAPLIPGGDEPAPAVVPEK